LAPLKSLMGGFYTCTRGEIYTYVGCSGGRDTKEEFSLLSLDL